MSNRGAFSSLLLLAIFSVACSRGGLPAEKRRDLAFFTPMINSSADFDQAASKISDLKVLTSEQKYDMRYALFDNGKFYYEVSNLGSGTGDWKYRDGFINLFASRSFFNLDIDLSAAAGEGSALEMRFADRFGNNVVRVQRREPSAKPLRQLSLPRHSSF